MGAVKKNILGLCFLSTLSAPAFANVSAEEAKKLGGPVLTAFGAEKAANADGSIPAYTGGMTTAPANYVAASKSLVDPFADEKPLYSVGQKNIA